jgi:hypothetical protein
VEDEGVAAVTAAEAEAAVVDLAFGHAVVAVVAVAQAARHSLESLPKAGGDDWAVVVVARAVLPCLSEVQVREAEVSRRMVILLLPGIGGTIEATSGILCSWSYNSSVEILWVLRVRAKAGDSSQFPLPLR